MKNQYLFHQIFDRLDLKSKFSLGVLNVIMIVIRKVRRLQQYFLTIMFFAKKMFLKKCKTRSWQQQST